MRAGRFSLTYSTNVHPGRDLAEVLDRLERHAVGVRERLAPEGGLGVGLWLASSVATRLDEDPAALDRLRSFLDAADLHVFTLNAFPFGDFHAERVKEEVYRPSWADPRRAGYTERAARILATLLPDGQVGSISTVAGGGRADGHDPADLAAGLLRVDAFLARLEAETGRRIVVALEPEPLTTLETTDDAIAFFAAHLAGATHLGLCYDVCHQAVVFEDAADGLARLAEAGIEIAKVQLSSALEIRHPGRDPGPRRALAAFARDRYFHQTYARFADGRIESVDDLPRVVPDPPPGWLEAEAWRTHYHVPIFAEGLGPLGTTRPALEAALASIVAAGGAPPHLEIETYTWDVLPSDERARLAPELADGIAAEFAWVLDRLA